MDQAADFPGAIIPVGKGSNLSAPDGSRMATVRFKHLVFEALERDEPVYLTIRKKPEQS
jgi:hypothetical protein